AEKITMNLSEDDIKDIVDKVLLKMKDDEKLQKIIQDKLELAAGTGNAIYVDQMMSDYDEGIEELQEAIDEATFNDGIQSTRWVEKDVIVKRDFALNAGEDQNEGTLTVTGEQQVDKENVEFAYEFGFADEFFDEQFQLDGSFTWDGKKGEDEVALTI